MTPGILLSVLSALAATAPPPATPGEKAAPLVARNSVVAIVYRKGPLTLTARGRALGQGGIGDVVRVINLDSRIAIVATVTGAQEVGVP